MKQLRRGLVSSIVSARHFVASSDGLQLSADRPLTDLEHLRAESGLSHSQIPIWIGQALHPASPLYNMAFAFVFEGAIDAPAFATAWRRVTAESDVLRTTLDLKDALPRRQTSTDGAPDIPLVDFADRVDPVREFRTWAARRCTQTLSLGSTLIDSALARLGDERYGWYLNQHHLVTDATSTMLLFQRVASAYAAAAGGAPEADLSPLPPYYVTAKSVASFPNAKARERASQHWRDRSRLDRVTPFYGRSSRASSARSERLTLALDNETSQRLRALLEEPDWRSLTPDIAMFALLATLLTAWLHRVSGKREIGFDAPAACRPTPASRRALGLFIEMFPFACAVEPGDTFRTLGGRCLLETQRFLASALPATASLAGPTSSNVVLNYFSGSHGRFAGIPVTSEWIHSGESDSVHALRLQVHDYDATGRYTLHFDCNEDVFPASRRERVVGHFERVLASLLSDPGGRIEDIDILTDSEREALLVTFNDTDQQPLPTRTIVDLFDGQVTSHPHRIALRQGARTITFAELQRDARAAAAALVNLGVAPEEPVAVIMKRSVDAVVAILAILQARAAYVPIDVAYPAARTRHILESSGARFAVVRGDASVGTPPGVRPLSLEHLVGGDAPPPLPAPRLDDAAYIMFTSGSTGTPKGVVVEHGGLADYLEWAARQYVRGDQLTFPLFTSLAFDLTVTSLFLPLITGGTLDIYPEPDGQGDPALMDVVRENRVDAIKLTPSHLSLLKHVDLSGSRIGRIVVGGEDFRTHLAADTAARFDHPVEIYNEYGPTEGVVGCMIHRFDPSADTGARVPIGKPADHVRLYVVDEALSPVPEGVPGELCFSRFGLARGYHGLDDVTARHFVQSPFRDGERLYRTGDLVRFAAPDTVEYLGRIDRQLKVSGIRVEPAEIEAALSNHPAVGECVVIATDRLPAEAQLPPVRAKEGSDRSPRRHHDEVRQCERCGLASNVPGVIFDGDGVCSVCRSYDDIKLHAREYFRNMDDLAGVLRDAARAPATSYDCMMLLSGGKDSTYALCRLVEMGFRVHAFTLDNGFISSQAKDNIRRVVSALGVSHEFATTPAMPAIFRDSLERFSNVCNGCFKTIYTLAIARARELGIPAIVTGLSRGQFFETRLTPDMFRGGRCSPEDIDAAVLDARKAYHRLDDEVSRSLDTSIFRDDRIFDEVRIIDFYRYCDAGLTDILSYLQHAVPWLRPSDTGRSTNCLINDVGIFVHKKERGYHNYALPYSWDVRLGQKTRREAIEELDDEIDLGRVQAILADLGYDERQSNGRGGARLAAFYVATHPLPEHELRRHLQDALPPPLVPQLLVRVERLPLTPNGKVDEAALRSTLASRSASNVPDDAAPEGPVEERIAAIWREVLGIHRAGRFRSFFELGGTSLGAMEAALRICTDFDVDLPLQAVFTHSTVARLAERVEALIVAEVAALSDEEADRLAAGTDAAS